MYNAKIHVLRENTTNNSRNSLPVLSAIWTFWKTTAAKHIFGDISNFFFQKGRLEIISVEFSHYSSANFRCWETKKKSFFMIHYPLYNNCHSKKVTKKSSFLLLIGFIYLTWHSKDHIILFFWPSRVFLQKDPHFKVSSIENTGQSSFFSEEKKEWLWGLLYLLVFLLLSKSLELFELIHFGMAKNHDDAFEVFSLQHWE